MNEPIYGVEFRFPEHMQKELDAITTSLAGFIIKTIAILYPDGDLSENAIEEIFKPKEIIEDP